MVSSNTSSSWSTTADIGSCVFESTALWKLLQIFTECLWKWFFALYVTWVDNCLYTCFLLFQWSLTCHSISTLGLLVCRSKRSTLPISTRYLNNGRNLPNTQTRWNCLFWSTDGSLGQINVVQWILRPPSCVQHWSYQRTTLSMSGFYVSRLVEHSRTVYGLETATSFLCNLVSRRSQVHAHILDTNCV